MILIGECGSTKSEWSVINSDESYRLTTCGINPVLQDTEEIIDTIQVVKNFFESRKIRPNHVFFYGAGCGLKDYKAKVRFALESELSADHIEVESDLLGAARGLFGKEEGIACIIGTGSNSCHFREGKIQESIPPLGIFLGDEGSGGNLGKTVIKKYLRRQLPEEVSNKLCKAFPEISTAEVLRKVYSEKFPNRYLASFVPFIKANIDDPLLAKIVEENFEEFFGNIIDLYSVAKGLPLRFVGSVAAEFEKELRKVGEKKGYRIDFINRTPIKGLEEFHRSNR
ncbi:uncharacterized protein LOC136031397 isoform X2 [Artemia franciscana]|uniref:uncharacterized protein LOC136031397 isoform X2 n=1 Tax=Artemia franciscana TaxID=6661 RepID=UPI0032DA9F03